MLAVVKRRSPPALAGDLALRQLEERAVELAQALRRDRALVRPRQILEDPLLAGESTKPTPRDSL